MRQHSGSGWDERTVDTLEYNILSSNFLQPFDISVTFPKCVKSSVASPKFIAVDSRLYLRRGRFWEAWPLPGYIGYSGKVEFQSLYRHSFTMHLSS